MVRRKANRSELLGKAGVVVLILSLSLSLGARWGKKSKLNQIEEVLIVFTVLWSRSELSWISQMPRLLKEFPARLR